MFDFSDVRRAVIVAMFSDDVLFNHLVLKGGNALNLVHQIGTRASLDVDFSMDEDFADLEEAKTRIFRALDGRMESYGFVVFDARFTPKPRPRGPRGLDRWGGYEIEFKIISKEEFQVLKGNPEKMSIDAHRVGPGEQRKFRIQISKYEYCEPKQEAQLDHYAIYVYPPALIAIEKLRAVCQQMPEYAYRAHPTPRGRDFYDIFSIVTQAGVDLSSPANIEFTRRAFEAKKVPLNLLSLIPTHREFHRPDWLSVQNAVAGEILDFDFYFDFVVAQTRKLNAFWDE